MKNNLYNEEIEKIIKSEPDENFVVAGRKITGFFENAAVTSDNSSNKIRFTMADTFDGVPLWDKEIKIIYKTPDGYTDFTFPYSISRENGIMTFSWLLGENVSRVAGNVTFAIRISGEGFVWNSLPGYFKVSQGIIESTEEMPEYAAEWIAELDEKLADMPQKILNNTVKLSGLNNSLSTHIFDINNPHEVTKEQIGLGNADNTADADKPISNETKKALDEKAERTEFLKHTSDKLNPHAVTKEQLGLENVDNTSDMNKPISYQALSEFDSVKSAIREHGLNNNNPHKLTKSHLGLSEVDNTSDADKPISTDTKKALNEKENILNKSTVVDSSANDRSYPTTKAVKNYGEKLQSETKLLLGGLVFSVKENGILNISKEE